MKTDTRAGLLVKVWPDFAEIIGAKSRPAAYEAANRLPIGIRCKIGNRLRVNVSRLNEWLELGGDYAGKVAG